MICSSRRPAVIAVVLSLLAGLSFSACGSDDDDSSAGSGSGQVVVSAAASLKKALTTYGDQFDGTVRLSFAGSDELAAQIRQGIKPDVFAAANTKLPDQLFKEGLVEQPVSFATNELVLAVPADSDGAVSSIDDLTANDVTIAIGAEGVPVGDYTRKVLDGLPKAQSAAILKNVRSNEPDVGGIVGKLTQGAVDAGFVYRSDVDGAGGKLKAIELPDNLKPTVEYGVAIVKGAKNKAGGQDFIDGLLDGAGATALKDNGFGATAAE